MPGFEIDNLDHLVLTVSNIAATVRFYEQLGMRAEQFDGGLTALHFGNSKINLHEAEHPLTPHARFPTVGSADLCFVVGIPLDDVVLALHAKLIPIEVGPTIQTGAKGLMRSIYLRDPDGNLIELSSYR